MPEPSWYTRRPRENSRREILNGIFHITRGGCSCRTGKPSITTFGCGVRVVSSSVCTPHCGRRPLPECGQSGQPKREDR
nr:transposase [Meiothermus taiwanensis]